MHSTIMLVVVPFKNSLPKGSFCIAYVHDGRGKFEEYLYFWYVLVSCGQGS